MEREAREMYMSKKEAQAAAEKEVRALMTTFFRHLSILIRPSSALSVRLQQRRQLSNDKRLVFQVEYFNLPPFFIFITL